MIKASDRPRIDRRIKWLEEVRGLIQAMDQRNLDLHDFYQMSVALHTSEGIEATFKLLPGEYEPLLDLTGTLLREREASLVKDLHDMGVDADS